MTPLIFFPGSFLDRILTIFGPISMKIDGSGSKIYEILCFFDVFGVPEAVGAQKWPKF